MAINTGDREISTYPDIIFDDSSGTIDTGSRDVSIHPNFILLSEAGGGKTHTPYYYTSDGPHGMVSF